MVRNRVDEMQYTTPVFLPPWVVHRQRHSTEAIAATESVPIAATEPIAQPSPASEEEWSDAILALNLAKQYDRELEDDLPESPTFLPTVTDSINELPSSTRRTTATSPIAKLEEADDEVRDADVGCYVEEAFRLESQLVESPPLSPSGSSTLGSSEDEGNAAPPVDPDDEPLPPLPEATTHRHPKQERSNLLI